MSRWQIACSCVLGAALVAALVLLVLIYLNTKSGPVLVQVDLDDKSKMESISNDLPEQPITGFGMYLEDLSSAKDSPVIVHSSGQKADQKEPDSQSSVPKLQPVSP